MDFEALIRDFKPKKNPYRVQGFSFGYRSEDDSDKLLLSPGPGAYNPTSPQKPKNEGIKFTHSPRFDSKNATVSVPGPGSYYKDSLDTTMNQTLTTSKNSTLSSPKSHGTFSKAQRLGLFNNTSPLLGPGQYGVKRDFETLPQETKVSKSRFEKGSDHEKPSQLYPVTDTPGPGQYDVSKAVTSKQKQSHGFSMPGAARGFTNVKQLAEQGLKGDIYRYNKHETIGKDGPKFTFGSGKRSELSPPNYGPGPLAYNTEVKDPRERYLVKGTFGQAARNIGESSKKLELGPSPAEYEYDIGNFKKGAKMSKSPKKHNEESKGPGPGQYDILDEFNAKKRQIEKQLNLQQSLITLRSPKNDKGYSEASGFEDQLKSAYNTEPASPNSASLKSPKNRALKTMWVEDIIKKSVSPGPAYLVQTENIEANLGNIGTKFSTLARPEFVSEEIKKDVPGPGRYDTILTDVDLAQLVKFPASKRKDNPVLEEYTLEIPGPDKYMLQLASKSIFGGSFGRSERNLGPEELSPLDKMLKRKKKGRNSPELDTIKERV